MNIDYINTIIAFIGGGIMAVVLIDAIFIWYFVGRRFDKVFPEYVKNKWAFENGWWIISPFFRACRYGGCILFKNATKKNFYCRALFKGYDFRSNAKFIDKFVIYFHVVGSFSIVFITIILFVINGFHMPSA